MPDLLIELFSEEIPARMQRKAADDLKRLVTDGLVEGGLTYASAGAFSTPRRLALIVEGLTAGSQATREERKGPREDAPEKALDGFLRSTGLTKDQLELREDKKGKTWFAVIEKPGRAAPEIIAEVLDGAIRGFPWPKSMRWGEGTLRWVRPLQSILCIFGDDAETEVVPLEIEGIAAGRTTFGHRFMAPEAIEVTRVDSYAAQLAGAKVMLDPARREAEIEEAAKNMAFAAGLDVVEDRGLLAEIAGLVEWPVPLMGEIGAEFLDLPPEVLQTSMKEHQKFLSVRSPKTGRIERFITVANVETADGGATILNGNQRVLAARLADAVFFWDNDKAVAEAGMGKWAEALKNVTFHAKLGTQAERITRIADLAAEIAPQVAADAGKARRAAEVAKLDLASEMVYEFPELQGVMGRYYSAAEGEEVAAAAEEHYAPLGPSDDVPSAPVSVAVALADKLDILSGFWAIDEKPTGSKDPFALRRAALGVIRLVLENGIKLPLLSAMPKREGLDTTDLLSFFHDRLKVYLRDRGVRHDVIDACTDMPGSDDLTSLVARAEALQNIAQTEDGVNLVQSFKRANNILSQAEEADGVEYSYGADKKFFEEPAEGELMLALESKKPIISAALESGDYPTAMETMAGLRPPIDAFFETVQVNSENSVVRRNRLNLLSEIRTLCGSAANLSRLEG